MKKYLFILMTGLMFSLMVFKVEAAEDVVIIGLDEVQKSYEAGTDPNSIDLTSGLDLKIIHENQLADDKLLVDYTSVDFNRVGTYPITYYVLYLVNGSEVRVNLSSIEIKIIDTTKPSLSGIYPIIVQVGQDISKIDFLKGVKASDNDLGSILDIKVFHQSVDTNIVGSYQINYFVTDNSMNYISKTTSLIVTNDQVTDHNPPTIQLKKTEINVGLNSATHDYFQYVEATDDDGSSLNEYLQYDDSNIDYTTIGDYQLLYLVSDFSGNLTVEPMTVHVVTDEVPPYFSNIPDEIHLTINQPYILGDGITAFDDVCGDVTSRITYTSNNIIDISKFSEYNVTFQVTDLNNNSTSKVVKVVVGDFMKPTISGPSSFKLKIGSKFNVLDHLTIVDNYDQDVTIETKINQLNLNKTGTYLIQVSAKDHNDNISTKDIIITVYAIDNSQIYEHPIIVGSVVGFIISGLVTWGGIYLSKKKKQNKGA